MAGHIRGFFADGSELTSSLARAPGCGCGDEAGEEGAGGWAFVVGAFGVPLDAEDELRAGLFHVEQFLAWVGLGIS